jgi:II/X family phage/plasmid replication protein
LLNLSKRTEQIDCETGEVLWQITTQELSGSYDNRLSIRFNTDNRITLSGSIHKFILGHNVFGGPEDIKDCCRYLVSLVNYRLGVKLPNWSEWELMRADVAFVFGFGSKLECDEFFKSLRGINYPRREVMNYGLNSIYIKGASTTVKAYNKGMEFKVHDLPRLRKLKDDQRFTTENLNLLKDIALRIVRFEVEVKKRKMKYDGVSNICIDLDDDYFIDVYVNEIIKIFKEGAYDMKVVRSVEDVKKRLNEVYSQRKASNLFSVWARIQVDSEKTVKAEVSKATWYRYMKDFSSAGISTKGGLVFTEEKYVQGQVKDFIPLPGSKYEIRGIFSDIKQAIEQLGITA